MGKLRIAAAVSACALVLCLWALTAQGAQGGRGRVAADQGISPADQQVHACIAQGKVNCNPDPGVYATMVAANPPLQPPSANPTYITEQQAVSEARGQGTPPAPDTVAAFARPMTRPEYERLDGDLTNFNPQRMVWVVTVHADMLTDGSPLVKPQVKHVYTIALDAETGIETDACIGCDLIKSSPARHIAVRRRHT